MKKKVKTRPLTWEEKYGLLITEICRANDLQRSFGLTPINGLRQVAPICLVCENFIQVRFVDGILFTQAGCPFDKCNFKYGFKEEDK